MRKSPLESVSAPSTVLPSSSTLALESEMTPPPRVLWARNVKRPKPPNGILFFPDQSMASRSDGASTAIVPSTLSVGCELAVPSNTSLSGAPASRSLTPECSPESAARKSLSVRLASIVSPRHIKWPFAPKLREIDGHATWNSTLLRRSTKPLSMSWMTMTPSLIPISENVALRSGLGANACANESIKPDQFDWPPDWKVTVIVGRTSVTSATSIRPASNGK